MKSLNDYFDKIYTIHLDGFPDRRDAIDTLSDKLNCNIEIFDAYSPNDCDMPNNMGTCLPNEYACSVSHLKLWEKVKKDNPKRPLILEDDAILNPDVDAFNLLDSIKDAFLSDAVDISFLGLNYRDRAKLHNIDANLLKVEYAFALHAYSPTIRTLKALEKYINIDELYKNPKSIDIKMANMYKNLNGVAVYPPIMLQKNGFSVIQNKKINYDRWLK